MILMATKAELQKSGSAEPDNSNTKRFKIILHINEFV